MNLSTDTIFFHLMPSPHPDFDLTLTFWRMMQLHRINAKYRPILHKSKTHRSFHHTERKPKNGSICSLGFFQLLQNRRRHNEQPVGIHTSCTTGCRFLFGRKYAIEALIKIISPSTRRAAEVCGLEQWICLSCSNDGPAVRQSCVGKTNPG